MSKPFCQTSREVMPDERQVRELGQAEGAQQVGLARGLARQVLGRVLLRDVRVDARVPLVVVDAVQDAREVARRASAATPSKPSPCSGPWISRA